MLVIAGGILLAVFILTMIRALPTILFYLALIYLIGWLAGW